MSLPLRPASLAVLLSALGPAKVPPAAGRRRQSLAWSQGV